MVGPAISSSARSSTLHTGCTYCLPDKDSVCSMVGMPYWLETGVATDRFVKPKPSCIPSLHAQHRWTDVIQRYNLMLPCYSFYYVQLLRVWQAPGGRTAAPDRDHIILANIAHLACVPALSMRHALLSCRRWGLLGAACHMQQARWSAHCICVIAIFDTE